MNQDEPGWTGWIGLWTGSKFWTACQAFQNLAPVHKPLFWFSSDIPIMFFNNCLKTYRNINCWGISFFQTWDKLLYFINFKFNPTNLLLLVRKLGWTGWTSTPMILFHWKLLFRQPWIQGLLSWGPYVSLDTHIKTYCQLWCLWLQWP